MTLKEVPQRCPDFLKRLGGTNFVLADAFVVRTNRLPDQAVRSNAQDYLANQGMDAVGSIIFCSSQKNKLEEIIRSLKLKHALNADKYPQMTIVVTKGEDLFDLSQAISGLFATKDEIVKGIDGKNLTIVQFNAPEHIDITDIRSGLKAVALKTGEPAYPMHRTPAD